jgi:phthalate 4,5-cis-dihydrodiol dehydrogenase
MSRAPLRLGIAGLGRAFTLMVPSFARHPRIRLAAAADPRPEARARFAAEFGAPAHETVQALCDDPGIDAVYVATPHQHHAEHAIAAANAGKHVLVEKPMALTIAEAQSMGDAARRAGVHLVVGPSHAFDAPIVRAREIAASGELGRVRMVTALNFTDFLYRPRRPEELDTARGGGVLFSQAAHQVDVVRLLAGGRATSVRAHAGAWDAARPTEGAYGALMAFEGGAFATLSYSGYGHFDSDEFCDWIGETGLAKDPLAYGAARRALAAAGDESAEAEAARKSARNYGGADYRGPPTEAPWHEHFGLLVVSCEHGDVRPNARGVMVYGDTARRFEPIERPAIPRAGALDALCEAALDGRAPLHDAAWGLASLEACLAMLRSSREGGEVVLRHQVAMG